MLWKNVKPFARVNFLAEAIRDAEFCGSRYFEKPVQWPAAGFVDTKIRS
jgi:hypothetical protein